MHSLGAGWGAPAPTKLLCYSCKSRAAALYCRADAAFLCLRCDAQIHGPNTAKLLPSTRHARVWLCEVCEHAPASVTCNADAAALCVTCDADIHSVNPLARRHERSAVVPFYDAAEFAVKPPTAAAFRFLLSNEDDVVIPELKSEDIFFSDMDSFIDFDYPTAGDGVVPDQSNPATVATSPTENSTENFCGLENCIQSKIDSISFPSQNLSQSVSSSSLDVGVVPDRNTASDASFPAAQTATQLRGLDREARVMRYREKKKNRKFEKTIRYASRKAYAEIRPRIKGRFVKRSEINSDADAIFAGGGGFLLSEGLYGVVPSH